MYPSYITQKTFIRRSPHWQSKTKSSFWDAVSFDRYIKKTRTSLSFWMNFPKRWMIQPMDPTENATKFSRIWNIFEKDNTLKHNRKRKTTQKKTQHQREEQPQTLNVPQYCFQQTQVLFVRRSKSYCVSAPVMTILFIKWCMDIHPADCLEKVRSYPMRPVDCLEKVMSYPMRPVDCLEKVMSCPVRPVDCLEKVMSYPVRPVP